MSSTVSSLGAAEAELILTTLERASERCADPATLVYRRLFELRPDFEDLFVMDTDGGVRGSMLQTCFDAILGLVEHSPTQRVIVSSSRFAHDGYGVSGNDFGIMFIAIRDTLRDLNAPDWTADVDAAWNAVLTEIAAID